ncbi:MAG: arylsulfatase [Saprospiraceae bacterium]|nr:arylsulfatase [Saprospiraceae bacterium]
MANLGLKVTGLGLILLSMLNCNSAPNKEKQSEGKLPNIVYILADDLGYGDLGCYGQNSFQTPHLDRLAGEGMLFTQHYSGSTVCAPSRCALMTGMHTGHTFIRGNKEVRPEGQFPIPAATRTMAEVLKDKGYSTGAFGKWGLGYPGSEGDPLSQGFDRFYGYNCQRLGHHYYPYYLWDNRDTVHLTGNAGKQKNQYGPELIQEQVLSFIDDHKEDPFFLFVPSIIPHAELIAPEPLMEKYRGKYLPEKAYEGTDDGPQYRQGPYESQPESHAAFAAMVDLLDQHVGQILSKLQEHGLTDNTLVIFTSDNGPHLEGGADPDYFDSNGPLKGYKRDLYEGGIRVPMIAKWPGQIEPGTRSDHISAFWDVLPTLAEIVDADLSDPVDGISFLPAMTGQPQQEHDFLYWEFPSVLGRQAIRKGRWKAIRYDVFTNPSRAIELYDLSADPGEENNVASQYPEVVDELRNHMVSAHAPSELFPWEGER